MKRQYSQKLSTPPTQNTLNISPIEQINATIKPVSLRLMPLVIHFARKTKVISSNLNKRKIASRRLTSFELKKKRALRGMSAELQKAVIMIT